MSRTLSAAASGVVAEGQRRAADPASSAWVRANAGSGKTHVLTERVLRLLLSGVMPEQILCLTYTKAAAAEMRKRVSERLARWALLDDAGLGGELRGMEGRAPDAAKRLRARTLFAHALETPGGLKIVTIHAFCEGVLHRFPKEAGVPFDFAVMEDAERDGIILRARELILAGRGEAATDLAIGTLFALLSDSQIGEAIDAALAEGRKLRPLLADRPGAKRRLRRLLAVAPDATAGAVRAAIENQSLLLAGDRQALMKGTGADQRFLRALARGDLVRPSSQDVLAAFLTDKGTPRQNLMTKAGWRDHPDLAERLAAEGARVYELSEELRRAVLIERSEALLDVLGAIWDRYESEKRRRSLLDFDDLVERIRTLFQNEALARWVQYKLDAGISHILVDEGQDTNPEQWEVVKALADEFFVGDSAVERPRTLFAVGDEKQSIYSFQGADPELFGISGQRFAARALLAGKAFAAVQLHTSFRTLPAILKAVDLTLARADVREGVLAPPDAPVVHDTARQDPGGLVVLWPPVKQVADDDSGKEWPLTPPKAFKSAARQVGERIAGEIAGWIGSRRPLGPRGRAVTANDVLILVQSRNALFFEIIRALLREGLPTPGADRLAVTTHIGVLDLLALGDVLLNPSDDLQLAGLLRSPLFAVSEDELLTIAAPRGKEASLWQALSQSPIASAIEAYGQLLGWRAKLDFERPYEVFAAVLYAGGGLKKFRARLGDEIDDVMAAFLDMALAHEQSAQPSLQGFLAAMRASAASIKRELGESGSGVRVMTVHGAKGLEAPIVILADAASRPRGRQLSKPVLMLSVPPGPLLVHAPSQADHVDESGAFKTEAMRREDAEYWRRLYVGMTRAEDELYVTGALTKTGDLAGTWYEAIEMALRSDAEIDMEEGEERALTYPQKRVKVAAVHYQRSAAAKAMPEPALPLPPSPARAMIQPSGAGGTRDRALDRPSEMLLDAETARQNGIALHALLQHLSAFAAGAREQAAASALAVLLPQRPETHAELAQKAVAILNRGAFQALFGEASRAEVPFLARGQLGGGNVSFAGRIDRLIIEKDKVVIVDYKSDAVVPKSAQEVPEAYLKQLGIYALVAEQQFPGFAVETNILWTGPETLMNLPRQLLNSAVSGFTIE